jgi:hypothetical protein
MRTAPLSDYSYVPGGGMVHNSCIHPIANKHGVTPHIDLNDNVIENGTIVAHYDPCQYVPLDRSGVPIDGSGGFSPNINGWVQNAFQSYQDSSGNGWDEIYQYMKVPGFPSCYPSSCGTGWVDFFWNGLQPQNSGTGAGTGYPLIQPVLQYGQAGGGTGSYSTWVMNEWYCNASTGLCYPHGQISVDVNDTIFTEMYLLNQWGRN